MHAGIRLGATGQDRFIVTGDLVTNDIGVGAPCRDGWHFCHRVDDHGQGTADGRHVAGNILHLGCEHIGPICQCGVGNRQTPGAARVNRRLPHFFAITEDNGHATSLTLAG